MPHGVFARQRRARIESNAPILKTQFGADRVEKFFGVIIRMMMAEGFLGVAIKILSVIEGDGSFYGWLI